MRTTSNLFPLFTGLLVALLISCTGGETYSRFHHIENGKWYRDSSLLFTIDSLSPPLGTDYDVTVELTTNHGYPYRNLLLEIDQNLTDTIVHTDTLRLLLADEHGRWLGSGAGGLNQLSFPYRSFRSASRDSLSRYTLTIRQTMEDNPLKGVEKVGIRLVETNKNN